METLTKDELYSIISSTIKENMKKDIIPIRIEINSSKNKENIRKCLDTTLWFKIPVIDKNLSIEIARKYFLDIFNINDNNLIIYNFKKYEDILKDNLEKRLDNCWYQNTKLNHVNIEKSKDLNGIYFCINITTPIKNHSFDISNIDVQFYANSYQNDNIEELF